MADISLSIPSLTDIITIISPPEDTSSSPDGPDPTVTVTVTVVEPPRPTGTSSPSITISHTNSSTSLPLSSSSTQLSNTTTSEPEFITTTFVSTQGDNVFAVTTVIANPAGHVHAAPSNGTAQFFQNRAAVIGVFTALGIIIFASLAAAVACATHRRIIMRRRREEHERSLERRDFFDDEMNDVIEPSDKQWWGNTSGTSIPEPNAMQSQMGPLTNYEPVPPFLLLPSLPKQDNSATRTSAYSEAGSGTTVAHPYASASSYRTSGSYLDSPMSHSRTTSTVTSLTSPSRSIIRSPPPSAPLPPLPPTQLPRIAEGPPSTHSDGWDSQIQPAPRGAQDSIPLTQVVPVPALTSLDRSSHAISHPYASPPANRRSELWAGDVLVDLGVEGGVGRSLSGRRPPAPPIPPPLPPPDVRVENSLGIQNPRQGRASLSPLQVDASGSHHNLHANRMDSASQPSPIHSMRMTPEQIGDPSRSNSRAESGTGFSDGGWYDDESTSEAGKYTSADAAASRESVLGATNTPHYGYEKVSGRAISSAQRSDSKTSISEPSTNAANRRMPPHDPRYSGLFGVWGAPNSVDESKRQVGSLDETHGSTLQYSRSGVLRVTNE
ncbi:hypothetical protein FRB91_007274 [Serendipita sp. 411]|nr:hypothetical protein FRC15_003834 [Serendipita sp. 397]KAG8821975.1 hypothetical protein FRC18_011137 [Serendipita sp. 400]KAG8823317.1 hypothetical protein FRC19_004201 [Serendipita sp. 401]KAG8859620.1 hypothetical protein FRB91_007274 [Serendipita sp. 411]KAG9055095.1 hypothetical protein FS842_003137 [Serendipita sp. 407]